MPSNELAIVRSIVDGAIATLARAGESADLTLSGEQLKNMGFEQFLIIIMWLRTCSVSVVLLIPTMHVTS